MEEALRKSEERYRTILEEIKEGYGRLDLKGNWTFANNAAAESIGYKPEELMGMSFRQVTDEPTAEKMAGFLTTCAGRESLLKVKRRCSFSRTDIKTHP